MSYYDGSAWILPAPRDGQRLHSKRRPIGTSSLARGLSDQLETYFDDRRLQTGATLARDGRIHQIDISDNGVITAAAVGSAHYTLGLQLEPLPDEIIERVFTTLSGDQQQIERIAHTSAIATFDALLAEAGTGDGIIPQHLAWDTCSCPYGSGCKHQAALSYLITEMLDDDPLLILNLRGLSWERLSAILTATGSNRQEIVSPITFFSADRPLPAITIPNTDFRAWLGQLATTETELSPAAVDTAIRMLDVIGRAAGEDE